MIHPRKSVSLHAPLKVFIRAAKQPLIVRLRFWNRIIVSVSITALNSNASLPGFFHLYALVYSGYFLNLFTRCFAYYNNDSSIPEGLDLFAFLSAYQRLHPNKGTQCAGRPSYSTLEYCIKHLIEVTYDSICTTLKILNHSRHPQYSSPLADLTRD